MIHLTEENIITIQQVIEKEQNVVMQKSSLEALVGKYQQSFYDEVPFINVLADYFEVLINKHIFQNGNKRTAIVSVFTLLSLNGFKIDYDYINQGYLYNVIMKYFEFKDTKVLEKYIGQLIIKSAEELNLEDLEKSSNELPNSKELTNEEFSVLVLEISEGLAELINKLSLT